MYRQQEKRNIPVFTGLRAYLHTGTGADVLRKQQNAGLCSSPVIMLYALDKYGCTLLQNVVARIPSRKWVELAYLLEEGEFTSAGYLLKKLVTEQVEFDQEDYYD
jgi:hypothetical protein